MATLLVTGHKNPDTDSICSAISYAALKNALGIEAKPIRAGEVNKETAYALDYFQVEAPELVTKFQAGDKVILVDHNEKKQIIDGIDDAEIVENIDHHRIGGLTTEAPIFIHYEPVGCTATIITNMYALEGVEIPKQIAGLLLSAILSDTVLFRSPTCTEKDKKAAEKLAAIAGVDIETYGFEMLKAGANVSDLTDEQVVRNDMKEFSAGDKTITISQVSVMDTAELLAKKEALTSALEALRSAGNYAASFLMVTNIMEESTNLLYAGEVDTVVADAFQKETKDKEVYLPGVMSRKKQIVPPLLAAWK